MKTPQYPIIVKTYNENILKNFINLKMGPVYTEPINDDIVIYIIDENYPISMESIHNPYFILTSGDNFTVDEYFQDYFLKPLDYNIIKKKLSLFIQYKIHKITPSNEKYINIIKNFFIYQMGYHINALDTYYNLYKEKQLMYDSFHIHRNSLNLINQGLLLGLNGNHHNYLLNLVKTFDHDLEILWSGHGHLPSLMIYYIVYKIFHHHKIYFSKEYHRYIHLIDHNGPSFTIDSNINLYEYLTENWIIIDKINNNYVITIQFKWN